MSRISALYDLQQADSAIDKQQVAIGQLELALSDTTTRDDAHEVLRQAEATLVAARGKLKELEHESEESEKHALALEKKLYGGQIKGAKEADTAQHEIATYHQRHKDLDDQSLEAMTALEEAEASFKAAKTRVSEIEEEWEENSQTLRQQRALLQEELARTQAEREKRAKMVLPPDLPLYEKLRSQKQGVAVAELMNGKLCSRCRVELPLAKQREVKNGMILVNCPSCGRLLYYR